MITCLDRLAGATAVVVLATSLAACSSDASSPAPSGASSSPSSSPATASSTASSPSVSPSSEESSSTGAAPADGAEIALDAIRLNIPADWAPNQPQLIGRGASVASPGSGLVLTVGVSTAIDPSISTADFATLWRDAAIYVRDQDIVDDVMIGGQPWFHLSGKVSDKSYADDYGTIVGDTQVTLTVESLLSVGAAERQATIDSILASVVLEP